MMTKILLFNNKKNPIILLLYYYIYVFEFLHTFSRIMTLIMDVMNVILNEKNMSMLLLNPMLFTEIIKATLIEL